MKTCVGYKEALNLPTVDLNDKSFTDFYKKYQKQLLLFATKCLGKTEGALDVVHDCFIKLWQLKGDMKRIKSIKNYLYTMVRNRCSDVTSTKIKSSKTDQEWSRNQENLIPRIEPSTISTDLLPDILKAITTLPPKMQLVFRLYYIEGKSYAEIGNLLKTTPGTVRNQRIRALQIVQKVLTKQLKELSEN